jgi:flagellar assembly factor FliW
MTSNPDPILPPEPVTLTFPKGLVGFPQLHTYHLFEPQDGYPFKFLQSAEAPETSFICVDPVCVKKDYEVPLSPDEAEALALYAPEDALILTLVVIQDEPKQMTTNLAGPLVINIKSRTGYQLVLNSEQFPLRFPILNQG